MVSALNHAITCLMPRILFRSVVPCSSRLPHACRMTAFPESLGHTVPGKRGGHLVQGGVCVTHKKSLISTEGQQRGRRRVLSLRHETRRDVAVCIPLRD